MEKELVDKYHQFIIEKDETNITTAERIVFRILFDLTDRRGLKQVFDSIADEVKDEIIESWIKLCDGELNRDTVTLQLIHGWQLCPKCNGNGFYWDVGLSSGSKQCDICEGQKIISTINGLPKGKTTHGE